MSRVLIVEDELHIANLLEANLQLDGYETVVCNKGMEALQLAQQQHFDIILMDVMLPDSNGIDICRKIKHTRTDIPIMMLSALGQSSDRIKGLKSGADDYLPKPFDLEELALRMTNLLERFSNSKVTLNKVEIGAALIDLDNYSITRDGNIHHLSAKEALLLKFMLERRGQVLSRQQILDEVWGYEHYPNTRTIDNFVATFRKYIEFNPSEPTVIITIRGVGYSVN